MLQVSKNEILNRLRFDNPWWERTDGIENKIRAYPRRQYFPSFNALVVDASVNRAVILMGPRRVGKTVMVYHTIQSLISQDTPPQNILYLSLETPLYTGLSLEKLLSYFQEMFSHQRSDRVYVFFDEVQYLRDWEIHLKSLVDSFSNYKFVATGSAAAALRLKSRESGAGRFTDFLLPPLTFAEYLEFIGKQDELVLPKENNETTFRSTDVHKLNAEFINYLNYGGYPEAVFSKLIQEDSSRYIKSDIIDKVLLRDLPSLYGIADIQELNRLFTTLAYNSGNEISFEALSRTAGVAKNTLKRYLEYLEAAFLIKRVDRIDQNARRLKRATAFKIYLTNPSMRAALFGNIEDGSEHIGSLTETAIFSQWLHSPMIDLLHYARWDKGEVDIVCLNQEDQKPMWVVEVKWSDRVVESKSELNNCANFMIGNLLTTTPIFTTKTYRGFVEYEGIMFKLIPSSEYAYTLARNIFDYRGFRGSQPSS
ncbi:MAG TPA: ATP-binding protein [Gallionellaceae bacterium]|nr:ATP-binding protein [Gallionellaceae bacterium]